MSKISDELRDAEQNRQIRGRTAFSGYFSALKQELREELGLASRAPTSSSMNNGAVSSASLDEAIAGAVRQLAESEQQVAASQQLARQLEQERERLQQRPSEVARTTPALEATRVVRVRQLEALRECQALAHAASSAEEELRANAGRIAQITASQQQLAQELAQHQQQTPVLQQRVEQLRFKLAQALACTGTTSTYDASDSTA